MAPRLTALCILIIIAAVIATGWALAAEPDPAALQKACASGRSSSCAHLGVLLRHGRGVDADPATALSLQKQACSAGSQFSCGYAGEMIWLGEGTAADRATGEKLMQDACSAANFWSCEALRRRQIAIRNPIRSPDVSHSESTNEEN